MTLLTKKVTVLLDTNALLLFGQGIDVFGEVERILSSSFTFTVPEPVLKEVEKLSQRATKDGKSAKLALALVREKERRQEEGVAARLLLPRRKEIPLKILAGSGEEHADDAILRIAEEAPERTAVCTLDKGLQRRLLSRRIRVLGVKHGRLAIIE
jgi:rRNA-processing protein FCF1